MCPRGPIKEEPNISNLQTPKSGLGPDPAPGVASKHLTVFWPKKKGISVIETRANTKCRQFQSANTKS